MFFDEKIILTREEFECLIFQEGFISGFNYAQDTKDASEINFIQLNEVCNEAAEDFIFHNSFNFGIEE